MSQSADPRRQWWQPEEKSAARVLLHDRYTQVQNSSNAPYWLLQLFTFILLIAPQQTFKVLAPLRIAMLTAVMVTLVYGFSQIRNGKPMLFFTPGLQVVLILCAWSVVMVPFSAWPGGSVELLLDVYFKTILVFILLAHVINTPGRLQGICWGMALMSILLSLTTIRNYLAGSFIQASDRVAGSGGGLTGNPNDMALMLNLILPLCVALLLNAKSGLHKLVLTSIVLLLITGIMLTFSRAGFLTLCVTAVSYLWLLRKRVQRFLGPMLLLVVFMSIPFIPSGYVERISTIADVEEDNTGSAQERIRDMKLAVGLVIADPLLGSGIGMSVIAMDEARGSYGLKIHNVYLEYAVELGLPGLMLFLALYIICLRNTTYVIRQYDQDQEYDAMFYLAEGIKVSLLAFALAAFFHPVAYHFYFYYIAGLAMALRSIADQAVGSQATLADEHGSNGRNAHVSP